MDYSTCTLELTGETLKIPQASEQHVVCPALSQRPLAVHCTEATSLALQLALVLYEQSEMVDSVSLHMKLPTTPGK